MSHRVVALGASNLTRGFHAVVATAREAWGPDVEVLAALGHGRSYGMRSRILARTLPGILQCGLWRNLESQPPAHTRALVTDVGNDILYGAAVPQILEWVEECVARLRRLTPEVVLTGLPLSSLRRISNGRFLLFRSILVPSCRLPLEQVRAAAESLDSGLTAMASRQGARFFELRPEWYGFDPIHVRPRLWASAWREILWPDVAPPPAPRPRLEALTLYRLPPERQWLFGVERVHGQSGRRLARGGVVWLY